MEPVPCVEPLGLLLLAGLTSPEWSITIIDENRGVPDYASLPCPDLVEVTAFTSQAPRAYGVAAEFRRRGVPVVMGGIHATMCPEEALEQVDAVVTGEAENVWGMVLEDAKKSILKRVYPGTEAEMDKVPLARHDLLSSGYSFGSIQTTRGCPLKCSFCSVPAFNGRVYRSRPIEKVIEEFKSIREKYVLIVDDNLIGIHKGHLDRAKDLFNAGRSFESYKKYPKKNFEHYCLAFLCKEALLRDIVRYEKIHSVFHTTTF